MTTVAAPITVRDDHPSLTGKGDRALRWATRGGWVALGMQLAAMIVFSIAERNTFSLTIDAASYSQAWWLIAHGHLDAFSSVLGIPWWHVNGEWITWPLGLLSRPILSETTFLIFEDAFLVGAGAVGLIWIVEVVRRPTWPDRFPPWLAVSVYAMLIALDPWMYISIAWAWHFEPFDALVLMLAAYCVEHRQWKRAAIFVFLGTMLGSVGAVFLFGLGIATILAGRRWRRPGVIILITGLATVLFLASLKPEGGNIGNLYGYLAGQPHNSNLTVAPILKGALEHPNRLLGSWWKNRLDIYANLGPTGIIGVFSPWGLGVPLVALALSGSSGILFSQPAFQNAPVYIFGAFGTILVLRRIALAGRGPRYLSVALAGVLTANALLWAVVWLPKLPGEWLRVSRPAAAVLRRAFNEMPSNAEVLASQGVMGSFAQRQWIYAFTPGAEYPVKARVVYFVVTPNQGIEGPSVADELSAIGSIANDLHARLVGDGGGAWVFRWKPPRGVRSFRIGVDHASVPAWTAAGTAGTVVRSGTPADWMVASTGREGYLVSGDYWRCGIGHYQADVRLSANVPVNVEVWNQTADTLLARRSIIATNGLQDVSFSVDVANLAPTQTLSGSGPFRILPLAPSPGNSLEIRVWSAGGGEVSIYRLGLRRG